MNKEKIIPTGRRTITITLWLLLLVIVAFVTKSALAFQLCNNVINYAGRVVQSCKDNYTVSGNVYWKGRMVTKVTTGSAISKLGWNFWSDTRYCGGTAIVVYPYNSSYGLNITFWASTSPNHPIGSCPVGQVNQARVFGTHYWEQVGYSGLTETGWSYWRNLP